MDPENQLSYSFPSFRGAGSLRPRPRPAQKPSSTQLPHELICTAPSSWIGARAQATDRLHGWPSLRKAVSLGFCRPAWREHWSHGAWSTWHTHCIPPSPGHQHVNRTQGCRSTSRFLFTLGQAKLGVQLPSSISVRTTHTATVTFGLPAAEVRTWGHGVSQTGTSFCPWTQC